jgi:hypothetical protein
MKCYHIDHSVGRSKRACWCLVYEYRGPAMAWHQPAATNGELDFNLTRVWYLPSTIAWCKPLASFGTDDGEADGRVVVL